MNTNTNATLPALRLEPQYHHRVWGGRHLKPDAAELIGEAWIVYEDDLVAAGPFRGRTLAELSDQFGPRLLGSHTWERTGGRFPILIKLLDCADWLSLQVHPNDEQALALEGPGHFGKTEAWHVLQAEQGARLISGLKPGTLPESLAQGIREGTVVELAQHLDVQKGDTVMMHAGTVHALGPGLLIYEVQQTSDITYRIFDWNRPQANGRKLHIEQSVAVSDPAATGQVSRPRSLDDGSVSRLVCCDYFTLELLTAEHKPVTLDTYGQTFHAITVTEGSLQVEGSGWSERLGVFETLLVPAEQGEYRVIPHEKCQALKSSVEITDEPA